MENDNTNNTNSSGKHRNSDKMQSLFMIGVALIVIGITMFFIGYSQPKIYVNTANENMTEFKVENTTVENIPYESQDRNISDNDVNVVYPVNINTASFEELMAVNGIGETKANLIINYRTEIGRFNSIDDLQNIKGFGEVTIAKLAPYITV